MNNTRSLVREWLFRALPSERSRTWVVGVNGPQGSGKSTLTAQLVEDLRSRGLHAVSVSIDDFYLTRSEQQQLSEEHPGVPYFRARGYPGTHDVALGCSVLTALCAGSKGEVLVPVYDKGAFQGLGDRAARAQWQRVASPIDVLFFEGWMLGFSSLDPAIVPALLQAPNAALSSYDSWNQCLDVFVHLDAKDPSYVVAWRVEAEARRRAKEGKGLTDEQARAYVESFLPAYELWVPALRTHPPGKGPVFRVVLAADRSPLSVQERTH